MLALSGANVNYQDSKGKTALHHGVEKEFEPALLTWLVEHGASPDIEDRESDGLRAQRRSRFRERATRDRREPRGLERLREIHANRDAIVDDQDRWH